MGGIYRPRQGKGRSDRDYYKKFLTTILAVCVCLLGTVLFVEDVSKFSFLLGVRFGHVHKPPLKGPNE